MIVGFTGARAGCTGPQADALAAFLYALQPEEVHHGCAVGADAVFAMVCYRMRPKPKIVGHPCNIWDQQSAVALKACDVVMSERPPLDRNRDIVAACPLLVGCPSGEKEVARGSGTWATIRYGRKAGIQVVLVLPTGEIRREV